MDMESGRTMLSELVLDPANARLHGDRNIEEICLSLREFGQHAPLVVQRSTGRVLVGNGRLEAMRRLGWAEAWVVYVDDDNVTAVRRALADNRTAELAEWDDDVLSGLVRSLGDGADVPGWNEEELRAMIEDVAPLDGLPDLPSGDREPFQQMTFTLHDSQAERVKAALDAARALGPFEDGLNANGNGNALDRVCDLFLRQGNHV